MAPSLNRDLERNRNPFESDVGPNDNDIKIAIEKITKIFEKKEEDKTEINELMNHIKLCLVYNPKKRNSFVTMQNLILKSKANKESLKKEAAHETEFEFEITENVILH